MAHHRQKPCAKRRQPESRRSAFSCILNAGPWTLVKAFCIRKGIRKGVRKGIRKGIRRICKGIRKVIRNGVTTSINIYIWSFLY